MSEPLNILLFGPDLRSAAGVEAFLKQAGLEFILVATGSQATVGECLAACRAPVLLIDPAVPQAAAAELSAAVSQQAPGTQIMVVPSEITAGTELAAAAPFVAWVREALRQAVAAGLPASLGPGPSSSVLRKTVEALQAIVESSPSAIVILDPEGTVQFWNPAAEKIFGWSAAEAIGCFAPFIPEAERGSFFELHRRVVGGGLVTNLEHRRQRKDGAWIDVSLSAAPLRDDAGGVSGVVGVLQDVTEHRQAIAALRESENALVEAQSLAGLGSWSYGLHSGGVRVSREALRILNLNPDLNVLTDPALLDLVHEDERTAVRERLHRALNEGEGIDANYRLRLPGLPVRWVHLRLQCARDAAGRVTKLFGAIMDITDKQRVEAQLLRSQRLESIGSLASGVAHDLNNILSPILMAIPMIRENTTHRDCLVLLDTLESSAQRGADIVRQILTFARGMEGKRMVLQPRHLVSEMKRIVRETFPKTITLKTVAPFDVWPIHGDATQLHQVLLNLAVNARDAMPNGGSLTLAAENTLLDESFAAVMPEAKPGPYVVLSVVDTGIGMAPENLDRIFDPFFTTKAPGQGTGLGLSAAHGIVKSHGGFFQVQSKPGHGSNFKLYLPATPSEKPAPETPPASWPRGHQELVLLVDDEESVRKVSEKILVKNGYQVLSAADGAEGVGLYAQRCADIQVVLTDMLMPFMDGEATIRALRKINPGVKIIAASGIASDTRLERVAELGVQAFLRKPFAPETLLATLRAVLTGETVDL